MSENSYCVLNQCSFFLKKQKEIHANFCLLLLLNEHQVDEVLFVVAELLSRVQLFAIPWTVARQAPLSVGFSRQEDWSGLPFPSP